MDRAKTITLALTVLVGFAGCGKRSSLVVGSKNFTEQVILGEILAQHLEKRLGTQVERQFNLGGTLLAHEALTKGEIDLYPEYTGTALMAVLKEPPQSGAGAVRDRVSAEYSRRFGITLLAPLGFDNSFAMVVQRSVAQPAKLVTLSDAERFSPGWSAGIGYEFLDRADGWPALMKTYKLPVANAPQTMDLGLLYRALDEGRINLAAGSATDAVLSEDRFVVLVDDRHAFPPYEAVVLARSEKLRATPGLRGALEELSGKIPAEVMRRLNYDVDVRHRPPADVAREFLASMPGN